jgi:hypothetical protein
MSTSRSRRFAGSTLPLLLILACGGDPPPETAVRDPFADLGASTATAAPPARDACALITKPEADAILQAAVTPRSKTKPGRSECEYQATDGGGFSMKVYWSGGKEELAVTKSAMGLAPAMLRENGMEPGGMMALRPVTGLGDEAYYNPIVGSYVRKGDVLMEFDLRLLQVPTPDAAVERWRALAGKALGRL